MKRKGITLLILTVLICSLTSCNSSKVLTLTGDKIIKQDNDHLIVQGNVETKEININSKTSGKITSINVEEGNEIKSGQVLITIDNNSLMAKQNQTQAQIEAATAQVKAAEAAKATALAQLQKLQNGSRPEELDKAKAQYDLAQTTYDRTKALCDQGFVAKADLDKVTTELQVAKGNYEITKSGGRSEDISAAQAQVNQADSMIQVIQGQIKQAQGGLEEVQSNINDTSIAAPTDGTITQLNVEIGELVSPGMPLLVITNTIAPWIECNVKETNISKVKLNQVVSVKFPAYPNEEFKAKIVRINKKPDFAVKRATNDNGDFDVLSYGVKVELIDAKKALHPGMTAFVDFGK